MPEADEPTEASHSRTSGVGSRTHEASQIVVGASLVGLSGMGVDGIVMYLGTIDGWIGGSVFLLDALEGGKLRSAIWLDAKEVWIGDAGLFRRGLAACQAGGTGGG